MSVTRYDVSKSCCKITELSNKKAQHHFGSVLRSMEDQVFLIRLVALGTTNEWLFRLPRSRIFNRACAATSSLRARAARKSNLQVGLFADLGGSAAAKCTRPALPTRTALSCRWLRPVKAAVEPAMRTFAAGAQCTSA